MHTFFSEHTDDKEIILDPSESMHAIRVLRLHTGDKVRILDGKGNRFTGRITNANPHKVIIRISGHTHQDKRAPYYLHIAIAPTKNMNRFEFFLEKAVETGIDEITPLLCEHSERNRIRTERLEKITVAAMKQSGQSYIPRLNRITPFASFVQQSFTGDKLIAHCCTHEQEKQFLSDAVTTNRILLLVGPEGDFSRKELDLAFLHDYLPVSLGHTRLRTETAGIAVAVIMAARFFHTAK